MNGSNASAAQRTPLIASIAIGFPVALQSDDDDTLRHLGITGLASLPVGDATIGRVGQFVILASGLSHHPDAAAHGYDRADGELDGEPAG